MTLLNSFYKFKKLILFYMSRNTLLKLKSYDNEILSFSENLIKLFIRKINNFMLTCVDKLIEIFNRLLGKFNYVNTFLFKRVLFKLNLFFINYTLNYDIMINYLCLHNLNRIIFNFITNCNIYLSIHCIKNASLFNNSISFSKLPYRIAKYTLLRSPHADKKSREQFEYRTFQSALNTKLFISPNFISNMSLPSGLGFLYNTKYINL